MVHFVTLASERPLDSWYRNRFTRASGSQHDAGTHHSTKRPATKYVQWEMRTGVHTTYADEKYNQQNIFLVTSRHLVIQDRGTCRRKSRMPRWETVAAEMFATKKMDAIKHVLRPAAVHYEFG